MYLEQNGLRIVEQNFRNRSGEIDLIGWDDKYLVFIEVKYRSTNSHGYASEAINYGKIKKICRVSDYYRLKNSIREDTFIRFDVVTIDNNKVNWIKNAFDYI